MSITSEIPRADWVWYLVVDSQGDAWEVFHFEDGAQHFIDTRPEHQFEIIKVKEHA